ncbi:MAG: hypothetical protein ACP5M4_01565 [Acidobacteriaceae bacterium]
MATEQQEQQKTNSALVQNPDELELVAGRERENLEGWIPALASDEDIRIALEKAFDYRGDVTITRKDGSQITGYIFDRRQGATLADSAVRIIPASERTRLTIPYAEIAALHFSGRDTAAGKSFEAWVRKYWEKKAQGARDISIHPENLD